MKVITRYVFRELVPNYFVGLAFFSVILVVNQIFISVKYIVERNAPADKVGQMFLFAFPNIFSLAIPLSVAMASILTFSRLSSDSEIVAMRGSGISLMRTILPNLYFGIIMFALSLLFFDTVLPWGNIQYVKTKLQLRVKDPMAEADPREVVTVGNKSIRFDREDRKTKRMYDIHVTQPDGTITFARSGDFIDKRIRNNKLVLRFRLYDVYIEQKDQEKRELLEKTYAPVAVHTFVQHNFKGGTFRKQAQTMTFSELLHKVSRFKRTGGRSDKHLRKLVKNNERAYLKSRQEFEAYRRLHPKEFKHKPRPVPRKAAQRKQSTAPARPSPQELARRRALANSRRQARAARRKRRTTPARPSPQELARRRALAKRRRQARVARRKRSTAPARPSAQELARRRDLAKRRRQARAARRRRAAQRRRPVVKNRSWHEGQVRMATSRLRGSRRRVKAFNNASDPLASDIYELHKKVSLPFACFIFTLIGAPLGMVSRRSGKSAGFGYGLLIMFSYWILLVLGKAGVLSGATGPVFSAWMPNAFLGFIGGLLIIKKIRE